MRGIKVVFKGDAWPFKESEKQEWDSGFERGATWVWGNYHVDKSGRANTSGSCLSECMAEYNLSPIESCGAAEGIRYGLSQIDFKLKELL